MPIVVLTIICIILALDVYWWWRADRLLRPLGRARLWRTLFALFMVFQMLGFVWAILGRATGVEGAERVPTSVMAAVFIWHLLVLPLPALGSLLLGATRGLINFASRLASGPPEPVPTPPAAVPSDAPALATRRQFLGATLAAAPPVVTAAVTGYSLPQLSHFRIRRVELAFPSLAADLDGLTIAHVTDVHVGRFTTSRVLNKIVEETNALRADLVLMTGDLINMSLSDLPAALDAVRRLDAKHGVYLCEGNHDLIESGPAFRQRTKAAGVPLLVNESTIIPVRGAPVQLLGLRWGTGLPVATRAAERGDAAIRRSLDALLQQRRPDAFPILLAHHPHAFDPAAEAGLPLTLAGHTHGGQLMLTEKIGFGPLMFRYWGGLYTKGDSNLFVSNGVGNWFPLRTSAPAEIVHLTLRKA